MHEPFTGKHVGIYDELGDQRRKDEPGNGRRNAHDQVHRLGADAPVVRRLLSSVVAARAQARALGFTR